jgi:4-diphosphocytidyl-2-C-methyl-D-erythritol kinase
MQHPNSPVKLRAFAKINLSLKIIGSRPDGFHDIDSIMQSVSLHDDVLIKAIPKGIIVNCSVSGIKENIASKAAKLILDHAKIDSGIEITIKKNIPLAAGLAGGSADAAATLIGIDKLFGLNTHKSKLLELGAIVGSDVPFCLVGGTARCTGRGENVEGVDPKGNDAFILVVPKIEVSTKLIYENFAKYGKQQGSNELEPVTMALFPELKKIKEKLISVTGKQWRQSGSGPSLFMEMVNIADTESFVEKISALGYPYYIVTAKTKGSELYQ